METVELSGSLERAGWHRRHRVQVTRIYLDELPEPREDQLGLGILDLIRTPRQQVIEKARTWLGRLRQLKTAVAQRKRAVELVETVVLGHFPRLSRAELETMLQIKDFRETRVYQEALEEGREKGRAEGLVRGREEGLEQGREEVALRLLARNHSLAEVAELTGLSVQRLRTLKKKNGKNKRGE